MLIVMEGLDGAGKSTQVRLLKEYLEQVCPKLEYIHFPRYDAPVWGELVGKFLRGDFGDIESVHPQLVALIFAGDRRDAVPEIRRVLDAGGTVLLDRYVYSNIAYQCSKLKDRGEADELREWIMRTEYGDFELPRPDLNIFLDVPMVFVEHSLSSRRDGQDRDYLNDAQDIHEADIAFQRKVRDMYRLQAGIDPGFICVDCSDGNGRILPPDVIFSKVKAVYESHKKD